MNENSPSKCPVGCAGLGRLADRLRHLRGWRRVAIAFVFGALGALAFAPISFVPILWLCFPVLVFLIQGTENWKQAFLVGWAFSVGLLTFGLYWIAASMFVDLGHFWWAVPLSVLGLPAWFSLYYGFWLALVRRFLPTYGYVGVMSLALAWFLGDYTRGHLFSGFPWNLEAYAWNGVLPMLQITSIVGAYGLTLLTLAATFLFALLAEGGKRNKQIVGLSLLLLALIGCWGALRLSGAHEADVPGVRLRLVQPNVDQKHKWDANRRESDFQNLLDASSAPVAAGDGPITAVIWPETAATYYLAEDPEHRSMIAEHVPAHGALITGVIRRSLDEKGNVQYHNSLVALDSFGTVTGEYDKHHLVPFGEYIPYSATISSVMPLKPLIHLGVDFTAGDSAYTLHIPGFPPFSPLVCYEVIFSGDVIAKDDRPQVLVNVTNDGWYGDTAGPYQHFAMARTRAIEEGLPMARAANTGISGIVDAYGHIRTHIALGITGYTDGNLPAALPPTFFSRYRDIPFWILFVAMGVSVFAARRIRGAQKPRI